MALAFIPAVLLVVAYWPVLFFVIGAGITDHPIGVNSTGDRDSPDAPVAARQVARFLIGVACSVLMLAVILAQVGLVDVCT